MYKQARIYAADSLWGINVSIKKNKSELMGS